MEPLFSGTVTYIGGKGQTAMNFKENGDEIPTAKCSEKKAQLAKDEKIKSFWDTLVNDWLKLRAKPREKDSSKD
ncbi:MAG TPA: hypothetical protein VM144_01475 [Aestuariivirga sp.]|nr:hypothetical protein [Aestuariivirga sp.]